MKKTALVVLAALVLFTARPALANSAPFHYIPYDEGPHFTMGVLEDCDIGVEHEALDFSIHFEDEEPSFMDVSASYEMLNHGEKQTVKMAFPLLFNIADAGALLDASVTVDGLAVEVQSMLVSSVAHLSELEAKAKGLSGYDTSAYLRDLEMESLLSSLNELNPNLAQYQGEALLDIYTLQGTTDADYLEIKWPCALSQNPIAYGSSMDYADYIQEEDGWVTHIWLRDNDVDILMAVPSGLDPTQTKINVYKKTQNQDSGNGNTGYTMVSNPGIELVYQESMTMEAFFHSDQIQRLIAAYLEATPLAGDDRIYRLIFEGLQYPNNISLQNALYRVSSQDLVGMLFYEIPFEAGQTRQVSVAYRQTPAYFNHSPNIQMKYTYITSPARHYRDFGALNVSVRFIDRPEQIVSNVTSKSMQFEKLDENTYLASMNGLPKGQLNFSVYCGGEEPEGGSTASLLLLILIPILFVALVILMVGSIVGLVFFVVYRHRKRKKRNPKDVAEDESHPE